jgi:DNA polymerase/3'-5' exonuclease PolX
MTTKGFLLIFCFLSFFQKTYAQSKMQISVLNACVDYMLEKENIELLYVRNPSIESFCKADLGRHHNYYNLPFDSLEFLRIRNIGPQDIKILWPRLNLKRTIKLNATQLDSLRKVNLFNYLG